MPLSDVPLLNFPEEDANQNCCDGKGERPYPKPCKNKHGLVKWGDYCTKDAQSATCDE
jgi:hypothetical protein